jgi:hypothetical protein
MLRFILPLAALMLAGPATAQQRDTTVMLPDAQSNDEIIVHGLRIPREKLPTGIYWSYDTLLPGRVTRERTEMQMRCALKIGDQRLVRQIVDGEPNSAGTRAALNQLLNASGGCYPPDPKAWSLASVTPLQVTNLGNAQLDLGVIIEQVLRSHAPDAALTAQDIADPKVQDRFMGREGVRNRLRLPADRDALVFGSCLVRQQPVLATRLFRSAPGSLLERGLVQTILIEGRACTADTKLVTVDPGMIRLYVIDAFYRWVVAARGVDSLIPANA